MSLSKKAIEEFKEAKRNFLSIGWIQRPEWPFNTPQKKEFPNPYFKS